MTNEQAFCLLDNVRGVGSLSKALAPAVCISMHIAAPRSPGNNLALIVEEAAGLLRRQRVDDLELRNDRLGRLQVGPSSGGHLIRRVTSHVGVHPPCIRQGSGFRIAIVNVRASWIRPAQSGVRDWCVAIVNGELLEALHCPWVLVFRVCILTRAHADDGDALRLEVHGQRHCLCGAGGDMVWRQLPVSMTTVKPPAGLHCSHIPKTQEL